ncbi:beta-N-acetylhexosaminidase [Clostridiaceae bacterium 35-E11]
MFRKILFFVAAILCCMGLLIFFQFQHAEERKNTPLDPSNGSKNIEKEPVPKIDKNEALLQSMTLEEKIGQMLIVGYTEPTPTQQVQEVIQQGKIGGIVLFNRNYANVDQMVQVVNQVNAWNTSNPLPLFISIDEEGGSVSRIPQEGTQFPDAPLLGKIDEEMLTHQMGIVIGKELKALGVNLNYAPVLDIVFSKGNKLLVKRSFGNTPELVAKHGLQFIEGLQAQGVIGVGKHFPGHGATTIDSHTQLPQIMIDKKTLLSRELIPFKAVIHQGIDALMVGHIALPMIDASGLPASRSRILLHNLLRTELGFDGLVITDDIEMGAYVDNQVNLEEAVLQSIDAGVDVFLVCHSYNIQQEIIRIIKKAVKDHRLSENRIDASVLRVIRVKNKYHLSPPRMIDLESTKSILGTKDHKAVAEEIKRRAKK